MGRTPNEPDPSTGPLALFAAEHRRYRKQAGITQADLAERLNYTTQFVGMVEVAARTPCRRYVDETDKILGAGGGLINCWLLVSRMHVPKWFGPFVKVESECIAMREWESMVIPGLLQTAEYARALMHALSPHATDEQIDRDLDIRMQRQEILRRPSPPMLWAILDENALRRPAPDHEVMRNQYAHLLEMAELPHVVIQVLPFEAGLHAGHKGAFTIMERDDADAIVWAEMHKGGRFFDSRDEVSEYIRVYDHLRATALSPPASGKLIASLLE